MEDGQLPEMLIQTGSRVFERSKPYRCGGLVIIAQYGVVLTATKHASSVLGHIGLQEHFLVSQSFQEKASCIHALCNRQM